MTPFVSITGGGEPVNFKTAVLNGIAEDGGLYVPIELPCITLDQLRNWKELSYPDLAKKLLRLLIPEDAVPTKDLERLTDQSFSTFFHDEIIPHHSLHEKKGLIVQELFHGPTLSFKDVAMGFVVNLFDYFLEQDGDWKTIMVATSGDTGPAAASASIGKRYLQTWLLFPAGQISNEQRRQMTCILQQNIHPVCIENCKSGSDDCDAIISTLLEDHRFRDEMRLSSVNSINWARVMTQTIHFFYGYLKNVTRVGDLINFSVPCGAFGNMCAGSIAKKMGLPVEKLVVCNNKNDELSKAFKHGKLIKKELIRTLSSAIDITVPLNFWRFIYFRLGGKSRLIKALMEQYQAQDEVRFTSEQHKLFSEDFLYCTVSDESTLETIRHTFNSHGYLLDPHGAIAVYGAEKHFESLKKHKTICLATAHPAKFPEVTRKAIGDIPGLGTHPSIETLEEQCERYLTCDYLKWQRQLPTVMKRLSK